jgi:hypothetical protein
MKRLLTISLLLGILLVSCNDQTTEFSKKKLPKIAYTSLDKEKLLSDAIGQIGLLETASTSGRIMSGLAEFKSDSIMKVLQADSSNYTYTLSLKSDKNETAFRNLVFQRVKNGYYGFVLEYSSSTEFLNIESFTGSVRKYDLEGKLLQEASLQNARLGKTSKSGRTSACFADVDVVCVREKFGGWDHNTGAPFNECEKYGYVITIDCWGGSGGGTGSTTGSGTYIPDPLGGPGTGGSTGGSGSSGGSGGTNPPNGDPSIEGGIGVLPEIPKIKLIKSLLLQNSNFLIEIPCDQIQKWQTLTQHKPNQAILDKLNAIKSRYPLSDVEWQSIENASGDVVNLDYFPVTITTLPNNPTTGQRFTAPEFLNHIRTHMNDFVDTSITGFSPSTITGFNEAQIWNSNNPFGGVVHLNIGGGAGDGTVICTNYNSSDWIFSTIEVPYDPFRQGYDGEHPVSGNRQFGFIQNSNGSFTFYTRGVDRITDALDAYVANKILSDPFQNPDALWNSFKQGIYTFTQNNSGSALPPSVNDNSIYRPDWDKVNQVLHGQRPISDLGCN